MGEKRNAYRVLWGNLVEISHLKELGIGRASTKIFCSSWGCHRYKGEGEFNQTIKLQIMVLYLTS
jgi:hypothetical protein